MVRWILDGIVDFLASVAFVKRRTSEENHHTFKTHRITTLANEERLLRGNFVESVVYV